MRNCMNSFNLLLFDMKEKKNALLMRFYVEYVL